MSIFAAIDEVQDVAAVANHVQRYDGSHVQIRTQSAGVSGLDKNESDQRSVIFDIQAFTHDGKGYSRSQIATAFRRLFTPLGTSPAEAMDIAAFLGTKASHTISYRDWQTFRQNENEYERRLGIALSALLPNLGNGAVVIEVTARKTSLDKSKDALKLLGSTTSEQAQQVLTSLKRAGQGAVDVAVKAGKVVAGGALLLVLVAVVVIASQGGFVA